MIKPIHGQKNARKKHISLRLRMFLPILEVGAVKACLIEGFNVTIVNKQIVSRRTLPMSPM